jgi:hypothetical protein
MGQADPGVAELSVSGYGQLRPLAEYLHLALPDIEVTRRSGRAERGEQGALDVLTIATDSSVLVAVVNVVLAENLVRPRGAAYPVGLGNTIHSVTCVSR